LNASNLIIAVFGGQDQFCATIEIWHAEGNTGNFVCVFGRNF
jgi:hypothetical protein